MQALRLPKPAYSLAMKMLDTDIEIGVDGSVRLLSPLSAWLKPGRAHVLMTGGVGGEKTEPPKAHCYSAHARTPLETQNQHDFKHIPNLDLRNPFSITP